MNCVTEAKRLIKEMHENKTFTFAVVLSPGRGRGGPYFRGMARYEINRCVYLTDQDWRLVGVYDENVNYRYLADDLCAFMEEYGVLSDNLEVA